MKEFELYVPLVNHQGKRQSAVKLARLKKRLVARFGGLTYFPQKNEGLWRVGDVTFQDDIIIIRVIAKDNAATRNFWAAVKEEIRRDWRQKEVLLVSRKIKIL